MATATAWFADIETRQLPALHWVSVAPAHEGHGLGKAVVAKALCVHAAGCLGRAVLLHTQTWSHRAAELYMGFGFRLQKETLYPGKPNDYAQAVDTLCGVMRSPAHERMVETAE